MMERLRKVNLRVQNKDKIKNEYDQHLHLDKSCKVKKVENEKWVEILWEKKEDKK